MRFSLKWALAATAYVAFAATAIGLQSPFFVRTIWTISALALCYAIMVACLARGQRQAKALGFAVLCLAYIACLKFAPDFLPASLVLEQVGYEVANNGKLYTMGTVSLTLGGGRIVQQPQAMAAPQELLQSANAIGVMAAGLIGLLLGLLAFKQSQTA